MRQGTAAHPFAGKAKKIAAWRRIMADTLREMKNLAETLNHAARVYYQGQDEVMSNFGPDV